MSAPNGTSPLAPSAVLGGLRLLRKLGRGGMGEVWLARDEALGVDRAVKVLLPERAADPALRTRFTAEARTLAALGDVPGLVRVHAAGEDSATGLPYFVMDAHLLAPDDIRRVCAGRLSLSAAAADRIAACSFNGSEDFPRPVPRPFTLDDALGGGAEEDARALPERAVFAIAREIAAALDSLHLRKPPVVHRDLKPSNILFAADGRLLLADFGIAKVLDPDSPGPTLTGMQPGSHRYAAPEQREGRPATPAADWYALGVILYRALYSSFPEWGEAFPTLAGLRPVSPLWQPLLRDLLAKDPQRRLCGSDAVLRALDHIEATLDHPRGARRAKVAALVAAATILAATPPLFLRHAEDQPPSARGDAAERQGGISRAEGAEGSPPSLRGDAAERQGGVSRAENAEDAEVESPKDVSEVAEVEDPRVLSHPDIAPTGYMRDDVQLTPQETLASDAVEDDDLREFAPSMQRRLMVLLPVENPLDVVGLPPGHNEGRRRQAEFYGTQIKQEYRDNLSKLYARHLAGKTPDLEDVESVGLFWNEWSAWVARKDREREIADDRKNSPASPESKAKESVP